LLNEDIDAPLPDPKSASASVSAGPSPDQVSMFGEMGFTPAQARKAFKQSVRPSSPSPFQIMLSLSSLPPVLIVLFLPSAS
jgi:hypothetical protein